MAGAREADRSYPWSGRRHRARGCGCGCGYAPCAVTRVGGASSRGDSRYRCRHRHLACRETCAATQGCGCARVRGCGCARVRGCGCAPCRVGLLAGLRALCDRRDRCGRGCGCGYGCGCGCGVGYGCGCGCGCGYGCGCGCGYDALSGGSVRRRSVQRSVRRRSVQRSVRRRRHCCRGRRRHAAHVKPSAHDGAHGCGCEIGSEIGSVGALCRALARVS